MPTRLTVRAGGVTHAAEGLTYSGVVTGQPQPDTINVSVQNLKRTTTASPAISQVESVIQPQALTSPDTSGSASAADKVRIAAASAGSPTSNLPPCDTTQSILYCVYTIQPGDTLGSIAAQFGLKNGEVTAADLLVHSNAPDIVSAEDLLQIGQKVKVPTQNAVVHTVRSGETVSSIAETYDVTMAEIAALPQNGVADLNSLKIGQEILVPNPTRFAKPAPAPTTGGASSGSGSVSSGPAVVRGGQASRSGFIWPATGPISSYFGPAHPLGIDIDFFSNPNQPVGSAAAGVVTFAGGNPCCSYGYYVVVSHGNGFETLYAHLSSISVSVGQNVAQGQLLGYGGRTGYATGPHLHFEVHLNGSVVNPLVYLP
jgi:murein DD-endopeptidase MepM/ murein hydrolase activator NlpD